jgi:3-hydroxyacyl-CoA dehydrogenase
MTAINSVVDFSKDGEVGVVTIDAPPVNALSVSVREGLVKAFDAANKDDAVKALLLICAGRTFIAGADISEFGKTISGTTLHALMEAMDASPKPIVAAIHGTALGGGLETALAAHYRIAVPSARLGLPEVNLGLLPGAGGTQRLPRIVGVEKALEMITSGTPIAAKEALALGVADALAPEEELKTAGLALAKKVAGTKPRRIRDEDGKLAPAKGHPEIFTSFRKANGKLFRGFVAPDAILKAVEGAVNLPFDQGIALEEKLFAELTDSPESKAQRYAFFAERAANKIAGLPDDVKTLSITKVGVIGAGTMGGGIAMAFANGGLSVTIVELKPEALERGLGVVKKNYESSAKRGRFTPEEAEKRFGRLTGSLKLEDLADCDLVLEAVFERMDIKKDLFAKLDGIVKQGAILASNTSFLDLDEMAACTKRPEWVIGLHFFSPANVMKLLEIVRGAKTSDVVIATSMKLAKAIGKVGVLVGVGPGFVGNRMLALRQREAEKLILEGAMPWDVDRVVTGFGMPMGPFQMHDLAGLDIGLVKTASDAPTVRDELLKLGRLGQKTGAGYYEYDAERKPSPSPLVEKLIHEVAAKAGKTPRVISDQEILERTLYSMINGGAEILEEKKAQRASDIDVVWLYGYGFPVWRGGPMYYADQVGLPKILERIRAYGAQDPDWKLAALLEKLAAENGSFAHFKS